MQVRPLNEPMRPNGWVRFVLIVILCLGLRFYYAGDGFSFYWFVLLYFPMLLWLMYWFIGLVRMGLNRWLGEERIVVQVQRKLYIWYLNVPGGLALSELVYQGYLSIESS